MNQPPLFKFDKKKYENLKVLFIANDAPASSNHEELPHHYHTGYHAEIFQILKSIGANVWSSRDVNDLVHLGKNFDYVFTLLNRMDFFNSEIFVSSFCEYAGLKYLGAKPNIRALAEDKHLTKIIARQLNIPTSDWVLYRFGDPVDTPPPFDPPYFVKWRFGASSVGVNPESCTSNWLETKARIQWFHLQKKDVLVERLLLGDIITVPVINSLSPIFLPAVISRSDKSYGIITYEQSRKLEGGLTRDILSDALITEQLNRYASLLWESIRPVDYIRIDFRVNAEDKVPQLLEFNICCNISRGSAITLAANARGISHALLVSHILSVSLNRQGL